jgi:hypothetical protein
MQEPMGDYERAIAFYPLPSKLIYQLTYPLLMVPCGWDES